MKFLKYFCVLFFVLLLTCSCSFNQDSSAELVRNENTMSEKEDPNPKTMTAIADASSDDALEYRDSLMEKDNSKEEAVEVTEIQPVDHDDLISTLNKTLTVEDLMKEYELVTGEEEINGTTLLESDLANLYYKKGTQTINFVRVKDDKSQFSLIGMKPEMTIAEIEPTLNKYFNVLAHDTEANNGDYVAQLKPEYSINGLTGLQLYVEVAEDGETINFVELGEVGN